MNSDKPKEKEEAFSPEDIIFKCYVNAKQGEGSTDVQIRAMKMYADQELSSLRSELKQRDELIKEIHNDLKIVHDGVRQIYHYGGSPSASFVDSIKDIIKKANSLT